MTNSALSISLFATTKCAAGLPRLQDVFSEARRWHSRTSPLLGGPPRQWEPRVRSFRWRPRDLPWRRSVPLILRGRGAWRRRKRGCGGSPGSGRSQRSAHRAGRENEVNKPLYRDPGREAGALCAASRSVGKRPGCGLRNPSAQGRTGRPGTAPRSLGPEKHGKEAAQTLHSCRPQLTWSF